MVIQSLELSNEPFTRLLQAEEVYQALGVCVFAHLCTARDDAACPKNPYICPRGNAFARIGSPAIIKNPNRIRLEPTKA